MSLLPSPPMSPSYEFGKQWFLPQLGRHTDVGEVVPLSEEDAERLMHNEPGLLKPARVTAQAHPAVVRAEKKPRGRKPRARG